MPHDIFSAYPGLDFDDIRRQVDGRSLVKECQELASGIPRDVIDAASSPMARAIAEQQAIVDAAVSACPPWVEDTLSALGPQFDASTLSGAAAAGRQLEAAAGYAEHAGLAGRLARDASTLSGAAAAVRQLEAAAGYAEHAGLAGRLARDAAALSGAAAAGRQLETAAGYAEHAGLAGRLVKEWANVAPPDAMLAYQDDLEAWRSAIDKPHRQALGAIEALRQQIGAPYEQTVSQVAEAYAAGSAVEAYMKTQSQLSDLANEHTRAAHLAGNMVAEAARHALHNPLADYARQLREQSTGLDVDAVARAAGAFGVDLREQFSALAAVRAAWDSSSLAAAGLTAMQGMAVQLLRAPPTPPLAGRTQKARSAEGQTPSNAAPPTAGAPAADQRSLEDRRAESGLFAKESASWITGDAEQQLRNITLSLQARIVRVAKSLTLHAFMTPDDTPLSRLGEEVAAIMLEFHRFDPELAVCVIATWLRIVTWDRAFSAEEGLLRSGGSESIEDADVQEVRGLMIELNFLIHAFESMQNSGL